MPKGHTHEIWGAMFLIPLAYLYYYISGDIKSSLIFGISFLFGNFMLSPDLDVKSKSYSRWGILRFIWIPYRKIFKHRSFLSHFPIVSSIVRVVYLILSIIIVFSLLTYTFFLIISWLGVEGAEKNFFKILKNSAMGTAKIIFSIDKRYSIAIFLGLFAGDTIHYLLDVITTGLKSVSR